ncbi:MAG: TRAP transporter large permease [Gammaproteobacteria bacterium]|jgi:tripartite ATP-independent transporter DctM subunit
MEYYALGMFAVIIPALLLGYPVAFTLGAVSIFFGTFALGIDFFQLLPLRIWGIMTNFTLLAVPLFVLMGVILEKSGLAQDLLETSAALFGKKKGGLAIAVILVGALLAATTGVAGATVVTMGVIALPTMLRHGYDRSLACGTIAASGTLGQVIPPSIVAILLADIMGVPVGRLFMATLLPGLVLVGLYISYVMVISRKNPLVAPAITLKEGTLSRAEIIKSLTPPLVLMLSVLGSIFLGIASPTESAALGALGAILIAVSRKRMRWSILNSAALETVKLTSMVFLILVGATAFGLVFKSLGGDHAVSSFFYSTGDGSQLTFVIVSMVVIFILGFFLDFVEICFIVVPILEPIARSLGIDLLWFALIIAVNLQTSFLTPPFGFSLFYLKAVSPPEIKLSHIYKGITPFVLIQIIVLALIISFPNAVLWLPNTVDKMNGLL